MHKVRVSTISISLAFLVMACGSDDGSGGGAGGVTGTGGTTAGPAGGSTAGPVGGTPQVGGSFTGPSGGTQASGGTTTGPTGAGGTGATGSGGTGATGAGGKGGTGATGAGGTGATGAGGKGGTGATGTGGATVAQGGQTVGGSSSTGGVTTSTGGTTLNSEPQLVTSSASAYWATGTVTEVTSGNAEVTVNDSSALQNWDGFGGTFNEKGWEVLSLLDAAERTRALRLLFDAGEGAKFAYGRVPIGASDYATNRYTLNETPNDYTMTSFSIARDKEKLIPFIKAALAVKSDVHLWGSPWTPPTWMKSNNAFDKGSMKDNAQVLEAYALYLAKFVEEYGKEGLKIEAIHPQNEPNYEQDYPSCLWTGSLMAKFIGTYLGPAFTTRNLTTQIYLGTMSNGEAGKDPAIVSAVTGDTTAMKYVKGFGLQWNMQSAVAGLKSRNMPILQTEHKCGNYPWEPATFKSDKAPNDHAYAVESWGLISSWIKAGVTSYSAWNMVLDTVGRNMDTVRPWPQNALLTVDTTAKKLTITPAYYVFRHLSQYVDPGAKVVGTSGGDALAFKNPDGTIVAVLYNSGGAKTSIVSIGGKKLQFSMPANGWATINWK